MKSNTPYCQGTVLPYGQQGRLSKAYRQSELLYSRVCLIFSKPALVYPVFPN